MMICLSWLKEDIFKEVIVLIQLLDLCSGQFINIGEFEYVILDVLVCKDKGYWMVEFNVDSILCLKINQQYVVMGSNICNDSDGQFICSNL